MVQTVQDKSTSATKYKEKTSSEPPGILLVIHEQRHCVSFVVGPNNSGQVRISVKSKEKP
jgi:hypothetical protein